MMTKNITDEFHLLRSILHSDDDLQIRPSGDFNQVCLKLDYDIQIRFFIDSLNTSTKSLTINNLNDLRIYKLGNKSLLKHEQWINIRDYFNELIQQSTPNTSLYSIIQLIQEQISRQNYKSNEKKLIKLASISKEDASTSIQKFRGADLIFNRIAYDTTIDRSQVIIGYEDRFTGIHEIAFNEFKKVHEDEYGIPMHRIRYYKINQRIVWDRIKKFDILTGSEMTDDIEPKQNLIQGMYHFDQSINQWILCSDIVSLVSDNLKIPSTDHMYIPERCQFVTWNIFLSKLFYTNERYKEILKTLKSFLPDIICLQQVTKNFLNFLLDEIWLKENNYYIIIMESILDNHQGQLMLTKNFRPRAFSICPFYVSENLINNNRNEYIIARFGLNSNVTIDLVNVQLDNSNEKCSQILEYFFKTMHTQNYMIIGDFNFGDYDIIEENILQKYKYQINDLWKDIYDIDENPGYTFDPSRNTCAQKTSDTEIGLRLDRYLLHKLPNLSYSIEHLNMIGLETILIDSIDNKRINQSDHYALQLIIHFRIRSISHHSALVILPTMNISPLIESFRQQYDPLFNQWPAHINLFYPFFDLTNTEDEEENILLPLRLLLSQYESFNIEINEIDSLIADNHISFMKLNHQSTKYVKQLYEQIKQRFLQCGFDNEKNYNPSMTIAQFDSNKKQNQIESLLTLTESIQFPVRYVYILQQSVNDDTAPFHITYQLPLGSVLELIGLNRFDYISDELREFFNRMNLYQNEKLFEQKREKFHRLLICFERIFNQDTLHCFTYTFLPYGSFRLGLHGEDLDTVFVLSEEKSENNKTNLDQILFQLKNDPSALNNHIINLLETQIVQDLNNEIIDCRKIQALYPIISILFNDQTRVEIFVQSILNEPYQDKTNLLSNFHEPIHGVHDVERLITYVRFPPIFQHLLTFIRTWAQNVGLYGQVYGYLGGYSWAILCAYICHKYFPSIDSLFSIEQFFLLVEKFFSTYSQFNWSNESLNLYSNHSSIDNRGSMRILCPNPPFNNTSRSIINSTRYLIIQAFQNACGKTCEDILQLSNQFPDKTIQSIFQLKLSGETINELNQWIGYMKSRLAHFLTDCEDECDLFIQTDNKIEQRKKSLERFYSIGFQLNEQILSRHREFYYCLNKFLDQFKLCSFRSETMKISYKLMSKNDWDKERLQT